jgi:hypothetical protein
MNLHSWLELGTTQQMRASSTPKRVKTEAMLAGLIKRQIAIH